MTRIELEGVTRIFEPRFTALDGVSIAFLPGEIHTILGENGAGKTTLVRILSGGDRPTTGCLRIDREAVSFASPQAALLAGIAIVHQRPLLSDGLTVLENIILGASGAMLRRRRRAAEIASIAGQWDISLGLSRLVRDLSPADRLRVALLAALYREPSLLILDEPTAVLAPEERDRFMESLALARYRDRHDYP